MSLACLASLAAFLFSYSFIMKSSWLYFIESPKKRHGTEVDSSITVITEFSWEFHFSITSHKGRKSEKLMKKYSKWILQWEGIRWMLQKESNRWISQIQEIRWIVKAKIIRPWWDFSEFNFWWFKRQSVLWQIFYIVFHQIDTLYGLI